ncbi:MULTISPECIES: LysR family transcriptional regulator [Burkholderiaceae]|jgi:DNA-binding transcriptional LysR family regulator|uniref:LysR family transcriptional regulator n=1 Tax=Burkholderiaceae TaxID=119060 RepID=UPI000487755E|nr:MULTISPECIES: LysR family transcriptional regulator [Burkholderiaceae]KHS13848.1 transcriptional regulator [Burkholderia multivorans]MDR9227650.1 PCP degradation transcriptional activation protein [Burkholderia multivorans]PRF10136.1 LysR family transcriptional regulator [Burkholderia multivorans]USX06878.1 LysR family transcriptional regulator [Paraburkholderia fungorum]HDR9471955.1 LysR family transcriptional regulator [Burkholderia multivorans]
MNINTLDLNLLRVFIALYRERNVSRAAGSIGLTQPAMSNALLRLRRSCNDELFVRTNQGMKPTALAERLADPVRESLALLSNAFESPFEFTPASSSRVFRLLMSDAGEAIVLPLLINTIAKAAPEVRVEAMQIPHELYASMLESGSADLAVGNLPFLKSGFFQQRLFDDEYCCITRKRHRRATQELTIDDYLQFEHIRVSSGNAESLVDNELARQRMRRKIALVVTHYHTAAEVVAKTDLVAIVPRNFVADPGKFRLQRLPLDIAHAEVRQFWHRKVNQDPGNRWLRQAIAGLSWQNAHDRGTLPTPK